MSEKDGRTPDRIPIRFADDETEGSGADDETGLTPEELGRESVYEDETEMRRRIERGPEQDTGEGREQAEDADVAGSLDPSELPRSRNDQDTTVSHDEQIRNAGEQEGDGGAAAASAGPLMAELVATRAELRRVEGELRKAVEERQELTEKLARRQADFENYRKRTERERAETYGRAVGDVASRLLPVLDNLRRALDAEASASATESEEFRHFLNGVELISKQLNGVLEGLGIEVVPTVGKPFDPHVHEAVATEETDEFEPDTVMEEMQRGYRLGDKLLRPAMVKVATRA